MNTRKPKRQICKVCNKEGYNKEGFRKNLCPKHRGWFVRGYINAEGLVIDESKKPTRELSYTHCKIQGCLRKHYGLGFCQSHHGSFKRNHIDEKGNKLYLRGSLNLSGLCKVCHIKPKKMTKGFCPSHYDQHLRGVLDLDGKKIKEIRTPTIYTHVYWGKKYSATMREWSEILGVNLNTLKRRHAKYKGDLKKVLKKQPKKVEDQVVMFNETRSTLARLSRRYDLPVSLLKRRHYAGKKDFDLVEPHRSKKLPAVIRGEIK